MTLNGQIETILTPKGTDISTDFFMLPRILKEIDNYALLKLKHTHQYAFIYHLRYDSNKTSKPTSRNTRTSHSHKKVKSNKNQTRKSVNVSNSESVLPN